MDERRVIQSAGIVGFFTMLSRVLGLARDVLMANVFGTSLAMSAFVVAFTIPNLLRRLFGEGALSAGFVPVFMDVRRREGDPAAWGLVTKVASLVFLVLAGITLLGWAFAWGGLRWAEPGGKLFLILSLLRIMLPYMIFICLAALAMAVLNAYYHFAVPAAAPCLLNLVWIVALAAVAGRAGGDERIRVVAWAVLGAGVLQLLVQFPALMRFGYRPGWSFAPTDPLVRRVVGLMGPAALGLAVVQVNVLVDRLLAAWVGPWAPAALFYSERLIYLPLGIFATALGTVLLPVFSGHAAAGDEHRLRSTIRHALRNLLFIMIPASTGLLVLARPIVETIFASGRFTGASTGLTAVALQFYAPGLVVFSTVKVFVPAFYARQDTRTPVRVGLGAVGLNLALNVTFVLTWPTELKHAGLALGTVLSSLFNACVLGWIMHRRFGSPGWGRVAVSAGRAAACAAAMAAAAAAVHPVLQNLGLRFLPVKAAQVLALAGTIGLAAAVYFGAAVLLRAPELRNVAAALGRAAAARPRRMDPQDPG
jgi:putative peptidoglycan lipid II flippase